MGDPDLSSAGGSGGPGPERARGLRVLPAVGSVAAKSAGAREGSFLRRWGVLIGTLVVGAVIVVLIAVLWSSAPTAPDPRALPPAVAGP